MAEPTWGYRATTPDTPDGETLALDRGPTWGRIFEDGVLPGDWYSSPALIPDGAPDEPAAPKKKGKAS